MARLFSAALTALVLFLPASARAQDANVGALLELPAHRALMRQSEGASLAPFTTDGCSGGMSDSWAALSSQFPDFAESYGDAPPWEICCIAHDRIYHNSGGVHDAEASFTARLSADRQLRACVENMADSVDSDTAERYGLSPAALRASFRLSAAAMYYAVRLGGAPCSGLPWRWGYGYPDCSALSELTSGQE